MSPKKIKEFLKPRSKNLARKFFASFVALSTILFLIGPILMKPEIALAQDTNPPGIGHWSVGKIDGDATATTTLNLMVFSGDDQAIPGGSPALTLIAYFKRGWGAWATTSCQSIENSHLHRCPVEVSPGADLRTFYYFLEANDTVNKSYLSFAPTNNSKTDAQNAPIEATVYNTPSWTNTITTVGLTSGVKDGRCFPLTVAAPAATSTIYVEAIGAADLGRATTTWILLGPAGGSPKKFKIMATTTVGSNMELTLSGYTEATYTLPTCVEKFIPGATVWVDGTTINTTTSFDDATNTFGTFTLSNVPDGTWDVVAFKKGYGPMRHTVTLSGGQTVIPPGFPLPYGEMGKSGGTTGFQVIWSAPNDGMMGAPTEISINKAPILIAFSANASSTTITKSNILLKVVNPDGSTVDFPSYYALIYEPLNQNVTIDNQNYDFGPDAKAILYSTTTLATSTSYIVKVTSNVKDEKGNPVSGNDPAGGQTISFSTGSFFSGGVKTGDFGKGGAFMPPFVMSALPLPGSLNVATSTKIAIQFSEPMDPSVTTIGSGQVVRIHKIVNNTPVSEVTPASPGGLVLDKARKEILIFTPSTNLEPNTLYSLRVYGGARSSTGITMAPPGQEGQVIFQMDFTTGPASAGSGVVPTIVAHSLERYRTTAGTLVGVPTSLPIKVFFSTPIDPETINTNTVYLRVKGSTTNLTAAAEYDLMDGKVYYVPETSLNATTTYVLTLTNGIKDLTQNQNSLATTTIEFTIGGPDTEKPRLEFFNSDDYHLSLTFSEPMNAAGASDTGVWASGKTKWQTSVLNPANYLVYVDNGPPPSGGTAKYFAADSLASTTIPTVTFTYDPIFNTVEIEGLQLMNDPSGIKGGVRIWVNNVTDISGNEILDSNAKTPPNEFGANSRGGPVFQSMETFGMIGPSGGGMFGPPPEVGQLTLTDFGGKNPALMGMMPVGVFPMNTVAGATSIYMIDIPISLGKAIPAGGKIVLGPFPSESDVSGAKNADPNGQFAHFDINGPGPGKVVLSTATESPQSGGLNNDGVTVSGQIVTVTLGSVGTGNPDFIHLELDGIKNPTTPTQGGYKINIQTQDGSGRQLESFTSMPFFIMPKGKYNLVGQVKASWGTGLNGVELFGGSPSTGPLFVTTANNAYGGGQAGEYKIEGLNRGDVMLMPEPVITPTGTTTEFVSPMPQPVFLDDSVTANTPGGAPPCTSQTACYFKKDFSLRAMSANETPGLVVKIYGDFSAKGVGSTDLDIFAGGPNGFRVKTLTLNDDYSTTPWNNDESIKFYLPSTGDYMVGIGPALPKGPMGMAAPPMPDKWMPPKPEPVSVSGSAGNWTWVENIATPNDGKVQFSIQIADKTISGHVYDPAGKAVSNAEVFAYSPTEMFGNGTHVNPDGSFTLKVKAGSYRMGAFLPGAPPSSEIGVDVKSDGKVYVDGVLTTDLIIKLSKEIQTGYTISGTVYSDVDSKYPATDASVYAWRTDGPGHAETMTDSKGAYTLYVTAGSWKVGAYLPSHGKIPEQTVTVPPSKSGLKFAPAANITYVTLRERVWEDKDNDNSYDPGEGISGVNVSVISTSTDYLNSAVTNEQGIYEVKVPANTVYDLEAWSPEIGNLPPQKNISVGGSDMIYATSSDFSTLSGPADLPIEHATSVEITFYDKAGNATSVDKVLVQLDKMGAVGVSNDVYKEGVAATTMKVSTSTTPYILDIEVQGVPKELLTITPFDANTALGTTTVSSGEKNWLFATTTVNGSEKIKVILPDIVYVSGQVKDSTGAAVGNAVIHVEKPGTDIEFDLETDANGNYTLKLASSTTPYLIQADKVGYVDSSVTVYATTSQTFNPVIEKADYTISGTLTVNNSPPGVDCYIFAERLGSGYVSTSGRCDSKTGNYTIQVPAGDWEVSAIAEGYDDTSRPTIVQVSSANVSGANINISASQTLIPQETLGMTGNLGGSLVDKEAGFEMNIPRATLSASDSSTYNVKEKEISNIPAFTPTSNLVGDQAVEISAYKMSGSSGNVSTVSGLNGAAFVDKTFTKAELLSEGIDTLAEVEQTKMGTYDDSAQNWTNLPTTITYLDSNNAPVIPTADLSNVSKVVFNGVTKHFSKIGVTNTIYDGLAPAAPTNIQIESLAGKIKVSWTAVTTNSDGTSATDIIGYNIYRSTSEQGPWTKVGSVAGQNTTTFYDTTAGSGTYYYRVTTDTGVQSLFSLVSSGGNVLGTTAGGVYQPPAEEVPAEEAAPEEIVMAPEEVTPPTEEVVEIPTVTFEKPISEMTVEEIQAKIAEILAAIETLQAMLKEARAAEVIAAIPATYKFEKILKFGEKSDDVRYLQEFLKAQGREIYPEGLVTGYFGPLTKAAVIRFQEKYPTDILAPWGLTSGTGIVGTKTIAKINELLGR